MFVPAVPVVLSAYFIIPFNKRSQGFRFPRFILCIPHPTTAVTSAFFPEKMILPPPVVFKNY
jgi:hypothetical protein